jgi:hypothetical protein
MATLHGRLAHALPSTTCDVDNAQIALHVCAKEQTMHVCGESGAAHRPDPPAPCACILHDHSQARHV